MKNNNKQIEKLCSFYVSDWHLVTMILPYINCKIDEEAKIITILEKTIEENIKTLVEKLNLKNKNKILNINWEEIKSKKYSDIEAKLKKEITNGNENVILINGCKDYIETNNINVEKWIKNSSVQSIKIINLYEVTQFNNHIMEILDSHDKILNTSGEKEISEVFEGYQKGEKIQAKKVVGNTAD